MRIKRIALLAGAVLVILPDLPLLAARMLEPSRPVAPQSAQLACNIPAAASALNAAWTVAPDRATSSG